MRVTVCGAGPAGLGIAACLLSRGHSVFLYDMPEYGDRIRPFQQDPSIRCTGKLVHSGRLATDPAEALREAEAIFLVTHAAAHQRLARLFAGHLREGQVVVMCPGYVGGGLAFTAALQEAGSGVLPPFAEAPSSVKRPAPGRSPSPAGNGISFSTALWNWTSIPLSSGFMTCIPPSRPAGTPWNRDSTRSISSCMR